MRPWKLDYNASLKTINEEILQNNHDSTMETENTEDHEKQIVLKL